MNIYFIISFIFSTVALIAYLNYRFVHLPTTIALLASTLLFSFLSITLLHHGFTNFASQITKLLAHINFHDLLINGMLSFLLFAGSLTIDIDSLRSQKWEIATLASITTLASTFLIALLTFALLSFLQISIPFVYCLLFGALISPTDPIAVLAIFRKLNAPRSLSVLVEGESLFNDGVAIVIFLTIYQVSFTHTAPTLANTSILFLKQAIGGSIYGFGLGLIGAYLIKPLSDHKIAIFITLAMTTGAYTLAQSIGISGPLAMVVAGIVLGHYLRSPTMGTQRHQRLKDFWEMLDEILNALLFLLIGFEILQIHYTDKSITAALMAIPVVLLIRWLTVALPMHFFKRRKKYHPYTTSILVWGGLRGGLAVALALALPASIERNIILSMTYAVVAFALIVQGISIKPLVEKSRRG